jgi:mRNA-degrading endonuclease RelE of RelBE toxin-antitoxin system
MKVSLTEEAAVALDDLPIKVHARVLKILDKLTMWPKVSGIKRLAGDWAGHFRIRTGDYRLLFKLQADAIVVVKIGNRKNVYD